MPWSEPTTSVVASPCANNGAIQAWMWYEKYGTLSVYESNVKNKFLPKVVLLLLSASLGSVTFLASTSFSDQEKEVKFKENISICQQQKTTN